MSGLRVLITNNALVTRAGSELYVRDLALALLARGHRPVAYSTALGGVADELRRATVPVIDDLDRLAEPPDVIHGQHHLDTMTALLHFPGVPAVYVCHGWLPWQEAPPRHPRIARYVAVDQVCRDRLVCEHGIPRERVQLVLNFVDLARFRPRPPLPARPGRALVFSNFAAESTFLPAVRSACAASGVSCDVLGEAAGTAADRPEEVLGGYDLVFAKGRSALEALAVGAAVVLCDRGGCGPLVTLAEFDRLRALNFGVRTLRAPLDAQALAAQVARYDPVDAAAVCRRARAEAGLGQAVDALEAVYAEVLAELGAGPIERGADFRAAARYLRGLAGHLKQVDHLVEELAGWRAACAALRQECEQMRGERQRLEQALAVLAAPSSVPPRRRNQVPIVGPLLRLLTGRRAA